MTGLWVVLLTATLGALAVVITRPGRTPRGHRREGADGAAAWLREPPLPPEDAERRALDLLRSVVNEDEWEMFRDLGFICVAGRRRRRDAAPGDPARYRYLVYPHLPVVYANVGGAGCQVPLRRIERDLRRLERWSAARPQKGAGGASGGAGAPGPPAGRSSAVSSSIRR